MTKPAQLQFLFPPPAGGSADVLIIAGEHSGDEHAARMLRSAFSKDAGLKVSAVGGRHLQAAGAQLLFDLTRYSVVGFVEVLKHYQELKRLFDEIVDWIRSYRPKVVVFVDYPGMNLRIAKRLAKEGISSRSGGRTRLLYYISPQVWAWKEKRKFEMAKILDSLAVIFPFEVGVFADTSLETRFVGHPFLSHDYELPVNYDPGGPILLLPGSRQAAVSRIAPILLAAFGECLKAKSKLQAVCMYASQDLKELLESILDRYPLIAQRVDLKPNTEPLGARAVLTSSGTMSLSCALANIPGAVAYRTHPLTYLLGKALVKIPYIGIANLLLNRPLYPEYLQGAATKKQLAAELVDCIENVDRIKQTRRWSMELRELLDQPSSGGAAGWMLEYLPKASS